MVILKIWASAISVNYSIKTLKYKPNARNCSTFINIFRGVIGLWKTTFSHFFFLRGILWKSQQNSQTSDPEFCYYITRKGHRCFKALINFLFNCIINAWRGCKIIRIGKILNAWEGFTCSYMAIISRLRYRVQINVRHQAIWLILTCWLIMQRTKQKCVSRVRLGLSLWRSKSDYYYYKKNTFLV